jgi:hypothetical protein
MGIDPFGRARAARDPLRLPTLGALSLALACGSPPVAETKPKAPTRMGVARYLPLEDATVFSYETRVDPDGERGLLVLEVRRRRPELAELVVAGRAQRLNVSAAAVELVTGGALLREPLTEGASWRGDFGRVRVTSVARTVSVPAGTFQDCLETIEEATTSEGTKRTTTAFCPGVGIALRETEVEQDAQHATERIALKSYGRRFDPTATTPPPSP